MRRAGQQPGTKDIETRTPSSTTIPGETSPGSDRTTARIVGALYLGGMVIGVAGNILIQAILTSPNHLSTIATSGTLLAIGTVFWLATVGGDAAHGVLMFPLLKRGSERVAIGYLTARIVDATFIAVMSLLIVVQIPLGLAYLKSGTPDRSYLTALGAVLTDANAYAYEFGMTAVGVAGLILCSAFFRTRLVPRPLAVWGLVGYSILLCGSVVQILGFDLSSIHAIPGGLWELFIGIWLIAKGFNSSSTAVSTTPAIRSTTPATTPPLVGSVVA